MLFREKNHLPRPLFAARAARCREPGDPQQRLQARSREAEHEEAGRALEFATSRHWDTSGTGERYGPGHARWKSAVSGMLGGARARAKRTPGGACHYAGRWVTLTDDIGLLVGDRVSERR